MADRPLTLGFITLIKALCQQSFALTLPQNCVSRRPPSGVHLTAKRHIFAGSPSLRLRTANRGGFFVHLGLFVWVEAREQVERLTRTHNSQESERISHYFAGF